jgi:hypothetical protein
MRLLHEMLDRLVADFGFEHVKMATTGKHAPGAYVPVRRTHKCAASGAA